MISAHVGDLMGQMRQRMTHECQSQLSTRRSAFDPRLTTSRCSLVNIKFLVPQQYCHHGLHRLAKAKGGGSVLGIVELAIREHSIDVAIDILSGYERDVEPMTRSSKSTGMLV